MNPEVALFICIIFVFILLLYDSKRHSTISEAIWVPIIWTSILGSRFIGQWLDVQSSGTIEEGSFVDRIIFSLLIICAVIILLKRTTFKHLLSYGGKWFLIFFFYCFISIIWSDFSFIAFKRYIKEIGNILMVLVVLTEKDSIEAIKANIRRSAYILIPFSIVLIKYYPHLGRQFSLWTGEAYNVGVTTSKNMLGNLCLVAGLYFVWDLILGKINTESDIKEKIDFLIKLFLVGMIFWLFYKAQSTTASVCFSIGAIIIFVSKIPKIKENPKILFKWIIFTSLIYFLFDEIFGIKDIAYEILGKDKTLTGRSELWSDVLALAENPLFGTGYDSFWLGERLEIMWGKYWWKPTGSHNGYIESYLNLGIIGVLLIVVILLKSIKNMSSNTRKNYSFAILQLVIIFVMVMYNFVEAAFHGTIILWYIFVLVNFKKELLLEETKS
jgi:O-antigen ligase